MHSPFARKREGGTSLAWLSARGLSSSAPILGYIWIEVEGSPRKSPSFPTVEVLVCLCSTCSSADRLFAYGRRRGTDAREGSSDFNIAIPCANAAQRCGA